MDVFEFSNDLFKQGIELFQDSVETVKSNGVKLVRDTKVLRACSLGAISCNNAEEFYRVCRLHAPIGIIVEDFLDHETEWNRLFDDVVALCRLSLTKALLTERNCKSAKVLFDILTRRDSDHWADKKNIELKNDGNDTPISISIVGV